MTQTQIDKAIAVLLSKYDRKHFANIIKNKKVIDDLYNTLAQEAARIGKASGFNDPDAEFNLSDFPATQKRIDELIEKFTSDLTTTIQEGDKREWLLSEKKNAEMVRTLSKSAHIPKHTVRDWVKPNLDAFKAFQDRKTNGMGLSDRVWKLGNLTKSHLELALDLGLGEGKSAAELSRDVRQYLKDANRLFRRVRNKHGNLRLSKAAKAYQPGQGVYRSSYKNALRMTATENNMAYRTADHEKWGELDMVIGIEIQLSNNHTLNGKPFFDICNEMVGKYPKDFKFTGWHPFCRCIATPILADWNEVLEHIGEEGKTHYKGEIKDVPENYKQWIENNAERIASAKSVPYFIKDNYVGGDIANGLKFQQSISTSLIAKNVGRTREEILEAAKIRHEARTREQINDIQDRWALREDELQYSPEMRAMFREIEKELGIKRGFSMPYLRADKQNANPLYSKGKKYTINCQTCAPAYQLRRWGFDVTALGNTEKKGNLNYYLSMGNNWRETWLDVKGNQFKTTSFNEFLKAKGYKQMTAERYKEYFNEVCKEDGIYEIGIGWKGGGGHCTIVQRYKGRLKYVEPQVDNSKYSTMYWDDIDHLCERMSVKPWSLDGAIRCDNALFNMKYIDIFDKNASISIHTQRILNAAAERQAKRTKEEIKDIKTRWQEHKERQKNIIYLDKISKIDELALLRGFRTTYFKMVKTPDEIVRKAFIDRAAELRHAQRNDAEVQKSWNEWRKHRDLIRKTANNIWDVAHNYPYIDTTHLEEFYTKHRSAELEAETRKLAKQMVEIKHWEKKMSAYIPDIKTWELQFSKEELQAVFDNVEKKMQSITEKYNNDSYLQSHYTLEEYQLKKLKFEAYDYLGGNMGGVQSKYTTWQVSQAAYIKKIDAIEIKIQTKLAETDITALKADIKTLKAGKGTTIYKSTINAELYLKNGDLAKAQDEIQKAKDAKIKLEAKRAKKSSAGAVTFSEIPKKEAMQMFRDFENEYSEVMDDWLRPIIKDIWKNTLTEEERYMLTKYTQTYHYLNEPLREMMYSSWMDKYPEFEHDLPILTSALSKMKMEKTTVVRRGVGDYQIKELGKMVSDLEVGDTFIEGGFLSTAVKANGGFTGYDLKILVPKGAQGVYAEPFTHYNDNDHFDYESNTLWNGEDDMSFGVEREWIGQRGTKFKVIEKKGKTIYLQIIGQLCNDPTIDYKKYFRVY